MKRLIVFTGKHCKSCHAFIAKLVKHNIPFKEVSTDTPDGAMMAAKYHVYSLPTCMIGNSTLMQKDMTIEKIQEKLK